MDAARLGRSRFLNWLFRPSGAVMESRLRVWLFNPTRTLQGADVKAGQTVLEVGCGTGFFTLPVARIIGPGGRLIAMEPLAVFVERTRKKVRGAGLENVEVLQRDGLQTGLEDASVDLVLLLGVLPYPTLPLSLLLPETHRVLRKEGRVAVWLFPITFGVPGAILRSGLFTSLGKKNGVHNYRRAG